MEVLILNAGSSSIKFSVYSGKEKTLSGMIERIGPHAQLVIVGKKPRKVRAMNHKQAAKIILAELDGINITKVLHRVVHGGEYTHPMKITPSVLKKLKQLSPLAPLHMPVSIQLIESLQSLAATHIACFDTLFHSSLPAVAKTYAIPASLRKKYGIHRYGFHGFAHKDLAEQAAKQLGKPLSKLNLITCQLGNGASLCAIRKGKSVETTMGYTPLAGLVMGTRCGSIDPSIPLILCENGMKPQKVHELLEKQSGLLAVGGSNDVRDLLKKKDSGAKLALDLFIHEVRKYLGAYVALLGSVDAIVIGGGIASSKTLVRRMLKDLDHIGIRLTGSNTLSSRPIQVFMLQPDEERQMLSSTQKMG